MINDSNLAFTQRAIEREEEGKREKPDRQIERESFFPQIKRFPFSCQLNLLHRWLFHFFSFPPIHIIPSDRPFWHEKFDNSSIIVLLLLNGNTYHYYLWQLFPTTFSILSSVSLFIHISVILVGCGTVCKLSLLVFAHSIPIQFYQDAGEKSII